MFFKILDFSQVKEHYSSFLFNKRGQLYRSWSKIVLKWPNFFDTFSTKRPKANKKQQDPAQRQKWQRPQLVSSLPLAHLVVNPYLSATHLESKSIKTTNASILEMICKPAHGPPWARPRTPKLV